MQSLCQRAQSCQQLSDGKAKVLWYRGRNEVITQGTHKCSTPRGSIYYVRTPAEPAENGRRRRKRENVSIHTLEAQLLKANLDKRHCCPTAGNSSKIRLWGSSRELSIA